MSEVRCGLRQLASGRAGSGCTYPAWQPPSGRAAWGAAHLPRLGAGDGTARRGPSQNAGAHTASTQSASRIVPWIFPCRPLIAWAPNLGPHRLLSGSRRGHAGNERAAQGYAGNGRAAQGLEGAGGSCTALCKWQTRDGAGGAGTHPDELERFCFKVGQDLDEL